MKRGLGILVLVIGCSSSAEDGPAGGGAADAALASSAIDAGSGQDRKVRFVAMGDTGKGNAEQKKVADAVRDVCAAEGCDFVIMLGDNIYDSGTDSVDDPLWQERFEQPYADVDVPFYAVLGNHDYGGKLLGVRYGGLGNEFERGPIAVEYTQHSSKWRMPDTHYVLREGPVGFVMMDTNSVMWDNQDNGDQEAWIAGALAEAGQAPWVIVAGHHPFLSNGAHGNAGSYELGELDIPIPIGEIAGDDVRDFFNDHICGNADLYLAGHDHSRQWLNEPEACGGTELIVSGAAAEVTPIEDNGSLAHFQEGEEEGFFYAVVDETTLVGRFYDSDGRLDFERTLTK
jgi:tartrate-resistant acid phosphatase type 5